MMRILDWDDSFQMGRDNRVFQKFRIYRLESYVLSYVILNLVNVEFVKNMVVPLPLKQIIPQRKPIFGMI